MPENNQLTRAPYLRARDHVGTLMTDVIFALLPTLAFAVYFYGPRAATLCLCCVLSCMACEALWQLLRRQPVTVLDGSAAVTGLLLAFCLPAATPYYAAALGGAFAILVVKQLYGGIGKNVFNPALCGWLFLTFLPGLTDRFTAPMRYASLWNASVPAPAATPLSYLQMGELPEAFAPYQLLLGQTPGNLGEGASIMLLLGFLFLLVRRVVSVRIPLAFLATVALLTAFFPQGNDSLLWMGAQLLSGSLLLGAFFMATDCTTSPATPSGQWLYGVGCGLLTVFLRYYGSCIDGVPYAILIMNALVWGIDRLGSPARFGLHPLGRIGRKGVGK